jgi:hypothetical protein
MMAILSMRVSFWMALQEAQFRMKYSNQCLN